MKKISILMVISMLLVVGCQYLATDQNASDSGITYVNLSELISSAKENQTIKEVVEDLSNNETTEEVVEDISSNETAAETETVKEEKTELSVTEIPTLKVTEGDLVSFPNLKTSDPDGDKIAYTFSKPLNEKGEWQTKVGDAGEKTVTITASDGTNQVKQDVRVIIESLVKAPVLETINDITVEEGKTLKLEPKAVDPQSKPVTITYSGFMTSSTKELDYDSAGSYIVKVTASNGEKETSQDVKITVTDVNRAPTFERVI